MQLHGDLELTSEHIEAIAVTDKALRFDVPEDLYEKLLIAEDEGSMIAKIQQHIVEEVSP